MYNVAQVIDEKCVAKKGCRLCIMYCPEANTLDLNPSKMVAEVIIDRCKGCELCVIVCDAAKHYAITMQAAYEIASEWAEKNKYELRVVNPAVAV